MPLYPGESTFPSEATFPSGLEVEKLLVLYTTSPASDPSPTWVYAQGGATRLVRRYETSRGRDSEFSDIDAGTATIILDNRARTFDPTLHTEIKPGNRWWIRERFRGVDEDVIVVYAGSYDQQWPGQSGKVDAVAVMSGSDKFKLLARKKLPTMSPPRDDYPSLIAIDAPSDYWVCNAHATEMAIQPNIGSYTWGVPAAGGGLASSVSTGPVVGSNPGGGLDTPSWSNWLQSTNYLQAFVNALSSGDVQGSGDLTVELWYRQDANPGSAAIIIAGPVNDATTARIWAIRAETNGTVSALARTSVGGLVSATSIDQLAAGTWNHLVLVADATADRLSIYVNGVESGFSASWSGVVFEGTTDPKEMVLAENAAHPFMAFGHIAIYRTALSAARVAAHYTAGTTRGFARGQSPMRDGSSLGVRVESILDAAGDTTPRVRIGGSNSVLRGRYMTGQDPLGELRAAMAAERPDGVMFVSRSGAITFLGAFHRSVAPYNTVQAVFDDDGTDNAYANLDVDYSDTFLRNIIHGSREGGALQTVEDSTSIDDHDEWPESLTDLPVTTEAAVLEIIEDVLAKYKNPILRARSFRPKMADPDVAAAVNALDIGYRIRVIRTPVGGGADIDEELFVQQIDRSGEPGHPRVVTLGVSPL